jgi:hypothetical protein
VSSCWLWKQLGYLQPTACRPNALVAQRATQILSIGMSNKLRYSRQRHQLKVRHPRNSVTRRQHNRARCWPNALLRKGPRKTILQCHSYRLQKTAPPTACVTPWSAPNKTAAHQSAICIVCGNCQGATLLTPLAAGLCVRQCQLIAHDRTVDTTTNHSSHPSRSLSCVPNRQRTGTNHRAHAHMARPSDAARAVRAASATATVGAPDQAAATTVCIC